MCLINLHVCHTFVVMKIRVFHKVFAFLLAFVILLTSTGLSIDIYYCKGEVEYIALFGGLKSYAKNTQKKYCSNIKKSCCQSKQEAKSENQCCNNQNISIAPLAQDADLQRTSLEQFTIQPYISTANANSYRFAVEFSDLVGFPTFFYTPPTLRKNIFVFIQCLRL